MEVPIYALDEFEPQIDELAQVTKNGGFTLRERLTIYPPYQREPWLDPRVAAHVAALADPASGLADESAIPRGRPRPAPAAGIAASGDRSLSRLC